MGGLRLEGMTPLTRHALWKKVEECRSLDSSIRFSSSPGSLPPSLPSSPPDPSPTPYDLFKTPSLPTSASLPLAPMPPSPLRITRFSVAVREIVDYMQSIEPVGSGILDTQAVMMQNIRLVEAARVIGGWRKASTVMENVNANITNNLITSRNIFGLVGMKCNKGASLGDAHGGGG